MPMMLITRYGEDALGGDAIVLGDVDGVGHREVSPPEETYNGGSLRQRFVPQAVASQLSGRRQARAAGGVVDTIAVQ